MTMESALLRKIPDSDQFLAALDDVPNAYILDVKNADKYYDTVGPDGLSAAYKKICDWLINRDVHAIDCTAEYQCGPTVVERPEKIFAVSSDVDAKTIEEIEKAIPGIMLALLQPDAFVKTQQ